MEHILGIDLHSDNGYYGIIESDGKRVFKKRLPNDLKTVLTALEPYKETIIRKNLGVRATLLTD